MSSGAVIRVSVSPGEMRVAGLVDDRLDEAWIERPSHPDGVGDLHMARVAAISAAMSGAFLTLAEGLTGFLPESELPPPRRPIAKALQDGLALPVRVTRAAQGGKGPRVTARLSAAELTLAQGADAPALLRRGDGAALRLAFAWPEATLITDSAAMAAELRTRLGPSRVTFQHGPAFDAELEEAFAELASPQVSLPGGASLTIHPTPALTAIDVDAGGLAGSRDAGAHERMNIAAAREVARQIRLRNLAGAILVDFAGMPIKRREDLQEPLAEALRQDPLGARLLGVTRLGLMEIVRPRVHPPLHELIGFPHSPLTLGLAALRRALREVSARPGATLALVAAPEVAQALMALPRALDAYRLASGRPLRLQPDPCLRPGQESIEEVPA
ncbi:ribonuclease E/G [Roseomonas sp. F4]